MSRKSKNLIGLVSAVSVTTLGLLIYYSWKKHERKQQLILDQIADEGYETAHDILYPLKKGRLPNLF